MGNNGDNNDLIRADYRNNRYMEKLSPIEFVERFNDVFRNFIKINDRAQISLRSIGSTESYRWIVLWTHVLEEAELRGNGIVGFDSEYINKLDPFLRKVDPIKVSDIREKVKGKECLFKYGKKRYLENLLLRGEIFLRAATSYADQSFIRAVRDNELKRQFYIDSEWKLKRIGIQTGRDGARIEKSNRVIKEMKTDYYVYCMSSVFDIRLFMDFEAEACLIIKTPETFIQKLGENRQISKLWYQREFGDIRYYDSILDRPDVGKIPFIKELAFEYQNEYRYIFLPKINRIKLRDKNIVMDISGIDMEIVEIYR